MKKPSRIAVFDLDHTLTCHDTFLLYLLGFLAWHPWRLFRCLHLPLVVILFSLGRLDNARLKQQFLQAILGGTHRSDLDRWTGNFPNRLIPRGMYRKGLAVLEQHRHAGCTACSFIGTSGT